MSSETANPSTGRRIRSYSELGRRGTERAVADSTSAFAAKQSGYGRELGPHRIREFVNATTLWMR
jgi:acyl-CoA reductase-like NAD-dependent aldehyde dehydrogenase